MSTPKPVMLEDFKAEATSSGIRVSWKAEKLKDFFTSLKATTESETETPADAANGKVRAAWQPSGTIWWGETQFTPEVKGDAEQLTIEGLEPNAYRVALEAWVPTEGTPEEGSWEVASEFVRVSVTPKKEEPEQRDVKLSVSPGITTLTLKWDPSEVGDFKFIRPGCAAPGYLWNSWHYGDAVPADRGMAEISGLYSGTPYQVALEGTTAGGEAAGEESKEGQDSKPGKKAKWTTIISQIPAKTRTEVEEQKEKETKVAETMESLRANFEATEKALHASKADGRQQKTRIEMLEKALSDAERERKSMMEENRKLTMSSEARVVGELWARGGAAWQHFLDLRNPKEHLDQLITLAGGDENIKTIVDVIEQSKSQEDQIEQLITSLPSK